MNTHTSILIIYTGGTIGMIRDLKSGSLKPFDFGDLYTHFPVLRNFDFHLDFHSLDPLLDSSNMTPPFYVKLAEVIHERYDRYDGFVVLHGSDTMAYTASALSFMLENLSKPVILTGSQLPIGVVRSDGRENFINAIEIAAACDGDCPVVPEVAICFDNMLYRGNRTTKFNAENFSAFLSVNFPPLAEIGVHIKYRRDLILPPATEPLKVHRELDNHIAILKLFPGITPEAVRAILNTNGIRALILETFGAGNAPTFPWFLQMLREAINKGIILVNVTQCKGGTVEMGRYETSAGLQAIGVIGGADITTESAVAKLMYLLGDGYPNQEVTRLLQTSLRGEMTV
ncbi:MAG: type I asparaginase [Bacteroidales bacterium]|nr:type I asparaginase [Bacteroidales bacterium]